MKILWCAHSVVGFKTEKNGYNGSGWITSLLSEFAKSPGIEIGVAFYNDKEFLKVQRNGVTFYPIAKGHINIWDKVKSFCGSTKGWIKEESRHLTILRQIINDFKPDVIHVWGTETDMGLIAKECSIPVIIHLQGLMSPYENALCPPRFSKLNFVFQKGISPIMVLKMLNNIQYWKYKSEREKRIFAVCKYYFGRTHWDYRICTLYSPQSIYFYCSELLRENYYTQEIWKRKSDEVIRITSTISSPLYKGVDLVLNTAKVLKTISCIAFEWYVVGINDAKFVEKHIGVRGEDVGVKYMGIKTAKELKTLQMNSNIYIHPSYIDNSPNSICEAQMLGMPVIAVNSGGVASLIVDGVTGLLVPSNEPHMMAATILALINGDYQLSSSEIKCKASVRHSKKSIIEDLLKGYNSIISK